MNVGLTPGNGMKQYDIIIAGGGPAGLSAAAELSKQFSVLVLEKRKPGTTFANWYSYMDRVIEHNLEEAIAFRSDHLHFVAPNFQHDMKDDCVVLDHDKVLQLWLDEAKGNGAEIVQARFEDYKHINGGVKVSSSVGEFTARLLIDAMGCPSKIVQKHHLVKRKDAWVLFGAKIRFPKPKDRPTRIEYYPLNDEANTYIGSHPFSDTETNFYIFKGQNNTFGNPKEMQGQFDRVLKEVHPDAEIVAPLIGTIPSGILKKYALDNVIFWGASGMLNPDGCGMGFNEILRQKKTFCAEIERSMKANRLDQKALCRVAASLRDLETMHFQRIIGAFSLYFIKSDGKWDGGVQWLNAMGPLSRFWMRNEMSLKWIRRATIKLHKAVPFKESMKMIPPNELLFITEQLIRFSVSNMVFQFKQLLGLAKESKEQL